MKILIAGDLVPTKNNEEYFINGKIENIISEPLLKKINSAEYRVLNLETPLCNEQNPIKKCGPNLCAKEECITGIKKINPTLITLANNHIMDQDHHGIIKTMKILKNNKINNIGVAKKNYYIINHNNLKIGFYACCEHEFSVNDSKFSANGWDELRCTDEIKELKKKCNKIIVLFHGGKEEYRYPSPNLQKNCRIMVDAGADFVICQHSHCIGCEEIYKDSTIVYGQGNFIFNHKNNEYWRTSLIIELNIDKNSNIKIDYIPIETENGKIDIADNKVIEDFKKRSKEITNEEIIKTKYNEFANKRISKYLISFSGNNIFLRIFNKLFPKKALDIFYKKKDYLRLINYIECEAHRELILQGLKNKITEKEDKK